MQAALYIKKKLIDDKILEMAWERDEVTYSLCLLLYDVHVS